jgi:hypothetical protein
MSRKVKQNLTRNRCHWPGRGASTFYSAFTCGGGRKKVSKAPEKRCKGSVLASRLTVFGSDPYRTLDEVDILQYLQPQIAVEIWVVDEEFVDDRQRFLVTLPADDG